MRRRALVAGFAASLAARAAHAHHPGGGDAEGGLAWLWLFLGIGILLAGMAAWAFSSDPPEEPEGVEDEGRGTGARGELSPPP